MDYQALGRAWQTPTRYRGTPWHLPHQVDKKFSRQFQAANPGAYQLLQQQQPILTLTANGRQKTYTRRRQISLQNVLDFLNPYRVATCEFCQRPTTWSAMKNTYRRFCSIACMNKGVVSERKATSLARWGIEPNLHPDIQHKKRQTFLRKYGVDHPFKDPAIILNMMRGNLLRTGYSHWTQSPKGRTFMSGANNRVHKPGVIAKMKATCLRRYGCEYALSAPDIRDKIVATNLQRYGVPNAGAVCLKKGGVTVVDAFGREHIVEGSEPNTVLWLGAHPRVARIVTGAKRLPIIQYEDGRNYHPDIGVTFVNGDKHLIECKSNFVLLMRFTNAVSKAVAATRYANQRGYDYWVFCWQRGKLHRIKNPSGVRDFHRVLVDNPRLVKKFRLEVFLPQDTSHLGEATDDLA